MRLHLSGLITLLVLYGSLMLVAIVRAQTVTDVDRLRNEFESTHADRRLAVIETRLDAVEFLLKGAVLGIGGQILLAVGMSLRSRKGDR